MFKKIMKMFCLLLVVWFLFNTTLALAADDTSTVDPTAKITLIISLLVLLQNFLKGVRDAIDKTPQTDDNWFEKLVTISGKVLSYFVIGKRA